MSYHNQNNQNGTKLKLCELKLYQLRQRLLKGNTEVNLQNLGFAMVS